MTEATYVRSQDAGLVARVEALLVAGAQVLRRRRIYSRTQAELSALTDRELADLGISRFDIARVAREAANEF
jgi:uncharacterized protein YjiS (DUF1127 family)